MNRFFFCAILFIGLSFVSTHVEAALASDISYGHTDYMEDPLFERLPHTYGEASVQSVSIRGLEAGPYLFTAYTDIQARDSEQAALKARWHAEHDVPFTVE